MWRQCGSRLALLVLLALCGCQRSTSPRAGDRAEPGSALPPTQFKFKDYNIVFVSFDALQAAHVGALGYWRDVTPGIDRFADRSFRFRNAMSVASWTVPASMTWFTGVYPSEHGMVNKYAVYTATRKKLARLNEVAPNLVTLAEALREHGYATAGFTGNAGVSGGFGYDQGFDRYDFEPGVFGSFDRSIPLALEWLEQNRERKFFLFLHGYDAHGQSSPAKGFDYRFVARDYDFRYTGTEVEQETLREEGLARGWLDLREADVRFWRAIYDEKIQRTDAKFQRFLAAFARLGLLDRTLFVLTSDHGTEFYEHRRFDHGFTLYNEQVHVPLFIRLPGQQGGASVADRISSIDVMPTILDLLDVEMPARAGKQLRGTSLVPALQGEPVRRAVFSETDYRQYTYKRSIITPDGWKLIYTLEDKSRELYYLPNDPGETRNHVQTQARLALELEEKLFAHFRSLGHDLGVKRWEIGMNPVYGSQGK